MLLQSWLNEHGLISSSHGVLPCDSWRRSSSATCQRWRCTFRRWTTCRRIVRRTGTPDRRMFSSSWDRRPSSARLRSVPLHRHKGCHFSCRRHNGPTLSAGRHVGRSCRPARHGPCSRAVQTDHPRRRVVIDNDVIQSDRIISTDHYIRVHVLKLTSRTDKNVRTVWHHP